MSDTMLDQLLDLAREPEPTDDGFVRSVMGEIKAEEQRRWRMKLVRRPVVAGVVTAVVAMSGAVAALVGTHVSAPKTAAAPQRSATVTVTLPKTSKSAASSQPSATSGVSSATPIGTIIGGPQGYPSAHTAWILDRTSGLKLTTETYTNNFRTGKAQRVTLTLLNTSPDTLTISGTDGGCPLQVVASQGTNSSAPDCATAAVPQSIVLPPGVATTMDALVTLPSAGNWSLVGVCQCSYSAPPNPTASQPTASPGLPIALPAPNLTGTQNVGVGQPPVSLPGASTPTTSVTRLSTPAISVRASR